MTRAGKECSGCGLVQRLRYVRGLGWGPLPSRYDHAESSQAAKERAAQEREHQATRDMVQPQQSQFEAQQDQIGTQQTQIGKLQNGIATILSLIHACNISIPDSAIDQIGNLPPSPPSDPQ